MSEYSSSKDTNNPTHNEKIPRAWLTIKTSADSIIAQTEKAYLIQIHNTAWRIWHPKTLTRESLQHTLSLRFPADFTVRIFINSDIKYNYYDIIEERVIPSVELLSFYQLETYT